MSEAADPRSHVVVWSGGPDPRAVFTEWDVFWIPFGLFWTWNAINIGLDVPGGQPNVFGAMFVVAGFYMSVGRLPVKMWVKSRTRYILTETQAQIVGPKRTHTFDLTAGVVSVKRQVQRGRVTVTFSADPSPVSVLAPFREAFENLGMGFTLEPGKDFPYRFYDVPIDQRLDVALARIADNRSGAREGQ